MSEINCMKKLLLPQDNRQYIKNIHVSRKEKKFQLNHYQSLYWNFSLLYFYIYYIYIYSLVRIYRIKSLIRLALRM